MEHRSDRSYAIYDSCGININKLGDGLKNSSSFPVARAFEWNFNWTNKEKSDKIRKIK